MVLMTWLPLSTLGVLTISFTLSLSAPLSLTYPSSTLSADKDFATETATVFITETVQDTMLSSTSSNSLAAPAPTSITGWKSSSSPLEEASAITEFVTVTVPALPIPTSTSTVEVVITKTLTPSSVIPATTIVTITVAPPAPTTWAAPAKMTDLSAFSITNFAGGSQNLRIVDDISSNSSTASTMPSNSYVSTEAITFEVSTNDDSLETNATSALQILYPENSIDPARKPQGGAEFYATPLDLKYARNVSLEYSVLFPQGFDWVLGGKLPGLYGGRQGCSGGDAAVDCFSTRLMWRKDGQGELYLYAPKDKQTDSLCKDSQSVCDAAYGLSVGRGSFVFSPGNWTKVRQTVTLNTPGRPDGSFTLDVNGERVIDRNDIYYRGIPLAPSEYPSSTKNNLAGGNISKTKVSRTSSTHPPATSTTSPASAHQAQPSSGLSDGGLFGPGGLLGGILRRDWPVDQAVIISDEADGKQQNLGVMNTNTVSNVNADDSDNPLSLGNTLQGHSADSSSTQPPGFIGLFFSTFFGGHEKQYASPKNQLVWFRDFAMSNNG